MHRNGTRYDNEGFDCGGFDKEGYNRRHFNEKGMHKNGTRYDNDGFDYLGYDKEGYNKNGYNGKGYNKEGIYINYGISGFDINGYDEEGFDRRHFNEQGMHRNGTRYDYYGYDKEGYDKDGFNKEGCDREGFDKNGLNKQGLTKKQYQERKDQQIRNYLGLKDKAKKLGKGEMELEDYVKCSKTSIDDLIVFAKKEKMNADVIRGLYKYKKLYATYKKPFVKANYLKSTTLIINGQEVKPTEQDVDKCVEYLKINDSLICEKTVKDTVRGYLKGEIDITIKDGEPEKQLEENNIAEGEYENKQDLVEEIVGQQNKIKLQENEIAELKSRNKGEI